MKKQIDDTSKNTKKVIAKGFPFKVKLFWITIMTLWLFKMVCFCYFSFSLHQSVYQQLLQIQKFEKQKNYLAALEIHENLIAQYPKYVEKHYFSIARCYLATSNTNQKFTKGIMYLRDKELTTQQISELQDVVVFMDREEFLSLFTTYVYQTDCPIQEPDQNRKKIYIFENYEMEQKQ